MVTFAARILLSKVHCGTKATSIPRCLYPCGRPCCGEVLKSQVGKYERLGLQYLLWPRVPSPSVLWWDGPFPPTGGTTPQSLGAFLCPGSGEGWVGPEADNWALGFLET